MPISYKYGEAEVRALAQRAGKARAAQQQLEMNFKKEQMMMDYQFRLAAEQRARAWDLEKMEIASRNDFQREEQARMQKQQRWSLIKKQIEETDTLEPQQKEQALYDNYVKLYGGVVPERLTPYQQETIRLREAEIEARRDPAKELIRQKLAERAGEAPIGGAPGVTAPVTAPAPAAPATQQVVGQEALKALVPLSQVPHADIPQDETGKFIVVDPRNGEQWAVSAQELPSYIEQGFATRPVSGGFMSRLWSELRPFKDQPIPEPIKRIQQFWGPGTGYINP